MKRLLMFFLGLAFTLSTATAVTAQTPVSVIPEGSAGVVRVIEQGQPPVVIHRTVQDAQNQRITQSRNSHGGHGGGGGGTVNLIYGGGTGGIGVETAPKIYLVFWGSQWTNNDPSGEASLLISFLNSIGGSSWFNDNTQYCQGVASGTIFCNGAGTPAGNQSGMLQNSWYDNSAAAPSHPSQSQLAAEAVNAAQHFGNTTSGSNDSVQYVIATATGNSSRGFGRQYCAWHSYTSSSYGNIAYTNLPYITDAGASCGANFNNLGPDAGITIVEGHEAAETVTDQFPSGGWLDSNGAETGDKCAWISTGQGASADVTFPDGQTFPVQSLWSNVFNSDSGGCVLSY